MQSDQSLAYEAYLIQQRRGWSRRRCCDLSHVLPSTWSDVTSNRWAKMTPYIRAKIEAFVATYRDDSVPEPPCPVKVCPRGAEHPLTKLSREARERIASSSERGVDLARELGVNPSTITRFRQGLAS